MLRCADILASRAWFEALGFDLTPEQHPPGPKHFSLALGSTALELYPAGKKSTAGARVGIRLADPVAASERALKLGGKLVSSDPASVVLCDLDGHTFELLPNAEG